MYGPTKEISQELMSEFNVKAIFYNPESFDDLKNKVTKKTKMILVENPGSNTFEFQDLSKIVHLAKREKILINLDKIIEKTKFKNVFIPPMPDDSGAGLGAAYFVYKDIMNNKKRAYLCAFLWMGIKSS